MEKKHIYLLLLGGMSHVTAGLQNAGAGGKNEVPVIIEALSRNPCRRKGPEAGVYC